jgi:hypothetical protein
MRAARPSAAWTGPNLWSPARHPNSHVGQTAFLLDRARRAPALGRRLGPGERKPAHGTRSAREGSNASNKLPQTHPNKRKGESPDIAGVAGPAVSPLSLGQITPPRALWASTVGWRRQLRCIAFHPVLDATGVGLPVVDLFEAAGSARVCRRGAV